MAESVQVPRDLLERLLNNSVQLKYMRERTATAVSEQIRSAEEIKEVRALLASSGVGSPEQPECPCKAPESQWADCLHPWHGLHKGATSVPVQPEPQTPAWKWSDDGGEYVRKHYDVPAHTNGRVIADGKPGVIVGFEAQYLRVVLDGETESGKWHPTWHMEYLPAVQPQTVRPLTEYELRDQSYNEFFDQRIADGKAVPLPVVQPHSTEEHT